MSTVKTDQDILLEIEKAMETNELQPYYQPLYDALSNKLVSAEALVRWVKADGTVVSPAYFIPVLEKSNAILAVDWYMLEQVCKFLSRQKQKGFPNITIAINFSRMHIVYENDFVEKLCGIVDQYEIDRKRIEIELTESAFVLYSESVEELVKSIRSAGFRVAIDDFGSGVSSLSFVKDVDVDVLKIDRSLLSHNCEDEKERIVLESIFTFAHRLKLSTVAEGVETREQLGFLRTCGCKKIQGFLFAKPMPEAEFLHACEMQTADHDTEDILMVQAPYSAVQMLMEAVFMKYPLVIFANLTRNSYYMMTYDNFSCTACPSTGIYDELIAHGSTTMHPKDQEIFRATFSIANQLEQYRNGKKTIRLVTRQLGDDGVYRKVETTNFFVKNPASEDVLVITLCDNLDELD